MSPIGLLLFPADARPTRRAPIVMERAEYNALPAIARIESGGRHWVLLSAIAGQGPPPDEPVALCEVYLRAPEVDGCDDGPSRPTA